MPILIVLFCSQFGIFLVYEYKKKCTASLFLHVSPHLLHAFTLSSIIEFSNYNLINCIQ